jgi:uncharacterized protein (TIGR00369 family)
MSTKTRTRTYEWSVPDFGGADTPRMTVLERYAAYAANREPPHPMAATIGFLIDHVEPGYCRIVLETQEHHFHGGGVVHGGIVSALFDSALASAVMTMLPMGRQCKTVSLTVNFLRGVGRDVERLFVEARPDNVAASAAAASASLVDQDGKVYAKAMATFVISASRARSQS